MGRISKQRAALKAKRMVSGDDAKKLFNELPNNNLNAKKLIDIPDKNVSFNANTYCFHEVIHFRDGDAPIGSFGDTLEEGFECFGGLENALDENLFDSPSDKKAFNNLLNPDIEIITFGDKDYGYRINRGSAISKEELGFFEEVNGLQEAKLKFHVFCHVSEIPEIVELINKTPELNKTGWFSAVGFTFGRGDKDHQNVGFVLYTKDLKQSKLVSFSPIASFTTQEIFDQAQEYRRDETRKSMSAKFGVSKDLIVFV